MRTSHALAEVAAVYADRAAAAVGPEGSLCLLLVAGPFQAVTLRPRDVGVRVIAKIVDNEGRSEAPDVPPPEHRILWAQEQLPRITMDIAGRCPGAGVALVVWFGDKVDEYESVWACSNMGLLYVHHLRLWLENRPS